MNSEIGIVDDGRLGRALGLAMFTRVTIGIERHANGCRSGLWCVIFAAEEGPIYDAVVDDFGNLVRVS